MSEAPAPDAPERPQRRSPLRVVLAALALVAVAVAVLAVLRPGEQGDAQPTRQQLDEAAESACERFEPLAAQVRNGELSGPPLYRALQDVFDDARASATPGFGQRVAALNTAAIQGDEQKVRQDVLALQLVCQQRRG